MFKRYKGDGWMDQLEICERTSRIFIIFVQKSCYVKDQEGCVRSSQKGQKLPQKLKGGGGGGVWSPRP